MPVRTRAKTGKVMRKGRFICKPVTFGKGKPRRQRYLQKRTALGKVKKHLDEGLLVELSESSESKMVNTPEFEYTSSSRREAISNSALSEMENIKRACPAKYMVNTQITNEPVLLNI